MCMWLSNLSEKCDGAETNVVIYLFIYFQIITQTCPRQQGMGAGDVKGTKLSFISRDFPDPVLISSTISNFADSTQFR